MGAPLKSDRYGSLVSTAFPEILETATEPATSERDDGVGTGGGPVHAGAFEASAHNDLAAGLYNAGGCTESLRCKGLILHAVAVAMDILQALSGGIAAFGMPSNGSEQIRDTTAVEFSVSSLRPLSRLLGLRAVNRFGQVTEMLFDVESINDLDGARKQFVGDFPDPGCAVTKDYGTLGSGEETASRFPQHALGERGRDLVSVQCGRTLNGSRISVATLADPQTGKVLHLGFNPARTKAAWRGRKAICNAMGKIGCYARLHASSPEGQSTKITSCPK